MLKSFFNWKVLLNIIVAIGVFIGLIWLTFRWLEFHTNHGQEVPLPNIMNMPVQDAISILEDAGLEYKVDSIGYDPKYKPLQVIKVSPNPGSRVKEGRIIEILVNPRTWSKVTVPDVLDRYKGLAFRKLEQVGLKIGDTIYEPSIQRDAVIRMQMNGIEVKPGAQVPRFSIIDLVVGTGPKRNVSVPSLIGLTVQEAEAIIKQNLFEIGMVEYEDGRGDKSDIIYYQDPDLGSLRDQGMQIDLWASKKTPGQMSGKINQLNSIYRMKVDTTLPPVRYEEVPSHHDLEEIAPAPPPVQKPKPKPQAPAQGTTSPTGTPKVEPAKTNILKISFKSLFKNFTKVISFFRTPSLALFDALLNLFSTFRHGFGTPNLQT